MITVFVKDGYRDVWDPYLDDWAGDAAREIEIVTYDELYDMTEITSDALIFCDIERMISSERELVADVIAAVRAQQPKVRILNDPAVAHGRYELLNDLFARGMNPFRVYRLTDSLRPDRFPVFLRYEDDHTGALDGLVHDQRQLDRAIVRAMIRRHDLRRLIIVEYLDTSDSDGVFTKYGLFRIDGAFLTRHAHRSDGWAVKNGGSSESPDDIEAEMGYLRDNPHDQSIQAVFNVALIDYGRIDYAIGVDGVVTWEINTNPVIVAPKADQSPATMVRQEYFIPRINDAFLALSRQASGRTMVDISEVIALASSRRVRVERRVSKFKSFARDHKRFFEPLVSVVAFLMIPFERMIISRWFAANSIKSDDGLSENVERTPRAHA